MPWGAAAAVAGAYMSSQASQSAADTQAGAARDAASMSQAATMASINEQKREFDQTQTNQAPFLATGQQGVYTLANLMGLQVPGSPIGPNGQTGMLTQQKSAAQLMADDPGYQFRLNQGLTGLNNAASAGGMQLSSNTLQGLMGYNQDYASNEYQNAWNRNQTSMQTLYNEMAGISGIGQGAANTLGSIGQATAANIGATGVAGANTAGGYLTSAAAATAAGGVGSANAMSSGLNNAYTSYRNQQLMSQLFSNNVNNQPVFSNGSTDLSSAGLSPYGGGYVSAGAGGPT